MPDGALKIKPRRCGRVMREALAARSSFAVEQVRNQMAESRTSSTFAMKSDIVWTLLAVLFSCVKNVLHAPSTRIRECDDMPICMRAPLHKNKCDHKHG
jgi:hypothetical protein